jgi:hypothetical protein
MDQATDPAGLALPRRNAPEMAGAPRLIRSVLAGIGGYLPETVVSNDELSRSVATSDTWIRERTGIHQRHIAQPHETCAYLATRGAQVSCGWAMWR